MVLDAGGLPAFIRLLRASDPHLLDTVVWALGNIAGDNVSSRDAIWAYAEVFPAMKAICISFPQEVTLIRQVAWALGNLCRSLPPPPLHGTVALLPLLYHLATSSDVDTSLDALWAVSYISDVSIEGIEAVLDAGFTPIIVAALSHSLVARQAAAIKNLRNLVSGTAEHVHFILKNHPSAMPTLTDMVTHPKVTLRREVFWTLVRIARHSSVHVQMMLQASATLIPTLLASHPMTTNDEMLCEVGRVVLQLIRHEEEGQGPGPGELERWRRWWKQ